MCSAAYHDRPDGLSAYSRYTQKTDMYDDPAPYHDVALICLNGHVINDSSQTRPRFNKKFCDRCGQPAIVSCPGCNKHIRGAYHSNVVVLGFEMSAPAFCEECGMPYPWTERKLAAAKEIAEEMDELSAEDKEKLKASLDDLIREGPRTEPAKLKFKNVMRKVGKESYEVMKTAVSDLVSETIRKAIFGHGTRG